MDITVFKRLGTPLIYSDVEKIPGTVYMNIS